MTRQDGPADASGEQTAEEGTAPGRRAERKAEAELRAWGRNPRAPEEAAVGAPPRNPSSEPAGEQTWRGVGAEGFAETPDAAAGFLRDRSRRLLLDLIRPHRRTATVAMGWVLLYNACAMAGPQLVRIGIDTGIGNDRRLFTIVAIFVVVAVVQGLAHARFTRASGRVGQDVLFDLRVRLFDHFQRLSISFHETYTSGRVISRLTSDVDAISELLSQALQSLVWAGLTVISITALMLLLDVPLALVALSVFPFVIAATIWFRRNSARAYRESRTAVALVIVHFVESLGGIRAVQAFRREGRSQDIFEQVNGRYGAANIWSSRLVAVYGPGVRVLGNVSLAAVLLVGGYRASGGQITVGLLLNFVLYLRRFFDPVQELSQFYNVFQSAAAALEKLSGVLDEEPAVAEPATGDRVVLSDVRGEVRFDHVTFAYRPDGPPVLPSLDLTIPAGQTVALVGETGAGKTTIARLVARFYDPSQGRVLLDGVDLRQVSSEDLRRAVVTVTQEGFLFSGTVADNIAFGRPDATRRQIREAARAIGADSFIDALADGYDTDVRKRGGRLSAGQRQLVAFARAFLADPRVLILDEATSSLDLPSERLVQRALRTLLADRTAIIIAHRLSTVEIADRVLVIDDGRIVEDGSPSSLLTDAGGRYAALHRSWVESLA